MIGSSYKIATLGDYSVGKTSIIRVLIGGKFDPFESQTIGVDYSQITKTIDYQTVSIEIWDTAGQEKYKSLVPNYIRSANIILIVYDITSPTSYKNIDNWIDLINSLGDTKRMIFIIGNKIDLADQQETQDFQIVKKEYEEKGYHCFFVSAKNGDGIEQLTDEIFHSLIVNFPKHRDKDETIIEVKQKKCC